MQRPDTKVMHLLNAYTFLGRRAQCRITNPALLCTSDITKVTCPECLAEKDNPNA